MSINGTNIFVSKGNTVNHFAGLQVRAWDECDIKEIEPDQECSQILEFLQLLFRNHGYSLALKSDEVK